MKQKSIRNLFLIAIAAIWLFVSVVAGLIVEFEDGFWLGFGFLTFAAAVAAVLLLVFSGNDSTIKDLYFSLPIYYVGAVYFAVSGIVSVIQMLTDIFDIKWMFIVQLAILAVFVVYFILCLVNKNNAENVIEKVKEKNNFIRDMTVSLNATAAICSDRATKIKIESLAEEFQYSAPASGDELYNIESRIEMSVRDLSRLVRAGELTEVATLLDTVKMDLIQRNALVKK